MPTEEEVEAFMRMTGLEIMARQVAETATKKDIEGLHRRIDQVIALINETVEKLEWKEERKPRRVPVKKKKVEMKSLQGTRTEIQVPSSQEMKEILDSQPQEGDVLNGMTSDVEMTSYTEVESVETTGDWTMVAMIQDTQEIEEEIRKKKKKKKKEKKKGIELAVPRVPIPAPKVNPEKIERKKYEQMKLRQRTTVDRLLKEFPWFNRRQMTVLMAASYFEAKQRWKIGRNFYTKQEIEEEEDPEFKETHGRSEEPLVDEVKECMAKNYADIKCIKNGVPMNTQGFKTYNNFYHEGLRVEIQLYRLRKRMKQYPSIRKYGKSDNYYCQVVGEDPSREEDVKWVTEQGKKQTPLPTAPKNKSPTGSWAQVAAQQTEEAEQREQTRPRGTQAPRNTPTQGDWIKVEAKKMAQNLPGNLRRVVIQRKGNRPLSGAENPNIISAANRAMATRRNSCRFQTCEVNSKGTITIMTREKEAAAEALKNSSDLIREIGKVCTEVTSIQPDET
jgi:hypothetical protein